MKTFVLLALLALTFTAFAVEIQEEDDVIVVTEENFDELLKNNEFILVEFYAPWCGHCKKLTPEWSAAAKTLKSAEKVVPLAKCDATIHKGVSGRFDVKGFPTIKFFNNGEAVEYNGGRVAKEIVAWVQKRTGDISQLLTTQEAIDRFTTDNKVSVVYFTEAASGDNWGVFRSTAMNFDKVAFAHVTDAALAASNRSALGKLVLYKLFDEGRNDYEGEFTVEALKSFVNSNKVATVMEFDDTAIEVVFQQGNPTLFLFQNESEESLSARKVIDQVAGQQKDGPVKFSYCDPKNQHWQRLADYVGVNTAVVPALMLVKAGGEVQKFKYEKSVIDVESITAFIQDFSDNKLSQHVKSEEIPADNSAPVKVLVGKNWADLVMNNDKDVLVKFYAPWCGHCKTLIPHWDAAALALEVNPNVVIAKCDATQNEIAGIEVKGFPTLKFFPGNNKQKPIDFNGDRTTEGILKFLQEKTTHTWVELNSGSAPESSQDAAGSASQQQRQEDL